MLYNLCITNKQGVKMKNEIINKIKKIDTEIIKESIIQLNNNFDKYSEIILNHMFNELELRLNENDFIIFCDSISNETEVSKNVNV